MIDDIEMVRKHAQTEKNVKSTYDTGGSCQDVDVRFERSIAIPNEQLRGSDLPTELLYSPRRMIAFHALLVGP